MQSNPQNKNQYVQQIPWNFCKLYCYCNMKDSQGIPNSKPDFQELALHTWKLKPPVTPSISRTCLQPISIHTQQISTNYYSQFLFVWEKLHTDYTMVITRGHRNVYIL